jgi:hypothetical protein
MERRRLQQQKLKQQKRCCVSQQDLTEAIARMKPTMNQCQAHRRATHDNLINISSSSSCSIERITIPSVSQLIKDFEERATSTPYASAQEFLPIDNDVVFNGSESNFFSQMSVGTIKIKDDNVSSLISRLNSDQTIIGKIHQDQLTGDKEQIHQTFDNDRIKRGLPSSSSSSSSYYSSVSNNNMFTRSTDMVSSVSKRHDKRFDEILVKEAQLNNALADLISLSNDISSSMSSSSRSLINNHQRRRVSSTNNNENNISASIALLDNLLETFDLDNEEYKSKTYKKNNQKNENDDVKSINMFW